MVFPKTIIIIFTLVVLAESIKLPSNFQKCNRKQPDLNECILRAGQHGISQLTKPFDEVNLPSLNPFEIPEVTIGETQGVVAVEQKFKNVKLWNLYNATVERFRFSFENKTVDMAGTFPEIKIYGDYELNGRVLLLPVKGRGYNTVILKNLKVDGSFKFDEVKRKGKTHMKFISSVINLNPELVTFNFENLFDGDERLGDNLNKVLNENWKAVFEDVRDAYVVIIDKIVINALNNFFAKVSIEEAFD